ncbi:uncharacterized protein LOC144085006 isoform X3 [Stigmatopora argus]
MDSGHNIVPLPSRGGGVGIPRRVSLDVAEVAEVTVRRNNREIRAHEARRGQRASGGRWEIQASLVFPGTRRVLSFVLAQGKSCLLTKWFFASSLLSSLVSCCCLLTSARQSFSTVARIWLLSGGDAKYPSQQFANEPAMSPMTSRDHRDLRGWPKRSTGCQRDAGTQRQPRSRGLLG